LGDHIGPELEARGFDEFSMPPGAIDEMSDGDRLAYLAYERSPAALLRGLNDIAWLPEVTES
jgi:hypothetical protein